MPSLGNSQYEFVLVIPVRNEARVLERSVREVHRVCQAWAPRPWRIIVADNGSTDGTGSMAQRLAASLDGVTVMRSSVPGKGRAIREAWQSFPARRYAFTDVDLSADLTTGLPRLVASLDRGADIACGARTIAGSTTDRPFSRRFISAGYQWVARLITGTRLHDLPCGFKAVNQRVVHELLTEVKDNGWFFDSELLLVAEAKWYRIIEVPIAWREWRYPHRHKALPVASIASRYLRGLWRIRRDVRRFKEGA